jgi:hypothetical protein
MPPHSALVIFAGEVCEDKTVAVRRTIAEIFAMRLICVKSWCDGGASAL